jgi:hypothetical protein
MLLNDLATDVLQRQRGKHVEYVFTYRRKPICLPNTRGWDVRWSVRE